MKPSDKTRVELHLTKQEIKSLDKIAASEGRSRKNFCETAIRKIIAAAAEKK